MDIYVAPVNNQRFQNEAMELLGRPVLPIAVGEKSVQALVQHLAAEDCQCLVLPDDFRRHNETIEHVKACARHMDLKVLPMSLYLQRTTPTPSTASVHATHEKAGVG